jgi:hypothetical protein
MSSNKNAFLGSKIKQSLAPRKTKAFSFDPNI